MIGERDLQKAIEKDDLGQVKETVQPTVWEQMINNFSTFSSKTPRHPKLNPVTRTPALTKAVQSQQPNSKAIVHELLKNGANPNHVYIAPDQYYCNPLLDSIQTYISQPNKRTREIAELMIDYTSHYQQPSINQTLNNGQTIAHKALKLAQQSTQLDNRQIEAFKHIINHLHVQGCQFDIRDNQDNLPQDYADIGEIKQFVNHIQQQQTQNQPTSA